MQMFIIVLNAMLHSGKGQFDAWMLEQSGAQIGQKGATTQQGGNDLLAEQSVQQCLPVHVRQQCLPVHVQASRHLFVSARCALPWIL